MENSEIDIRQMVNEWRLKNAYNQSKLSKGFRIKNNKFHVFKLLRLNSYELVINAYQAILKREPELDGLRYYASRLATDLTKIEFITALANSQEGRQAAVIIQGLSFASLIEKTQHLKIVKSLNKIRHFMGGKRRALISAVNSLETKLHHTEHEVITLRKAIFELTSTFKQTQETILTKFQQQESNIESAISRLHELEAQLNKSQQSIEKIQHLEIYQTKHEVKLNIHESTINKANKMMSLHEEILEQQNAKIHLQEANLNQHTQKLTRINQEIGLNLTKEIPHWDEFYLALEDEFRGPEELIKNRLKTYLPILNGLTVDTIGSYILDIGCGRGEWLELLHENNFTAIGIDNNAEMIVSCQNKHLSVINEDAFVYLQQQPANSIKAITGFHIIEHLPFMVMMQLVSECYRVLQEGGVLIFETPNPMNVKVGTCYFYMDPTHKRPIPPALAEFIFRKQGFTRLDIKELNFPDEDSFANKEEKMVYNQAQDYAVIGHK